MVQLLNPASSRRRLTDRTDFKSPFHEPEAAATSFFEHMTGGFARSYSLFSLVFRLSVVLPHGLYRRLFILTAGLSADQGRPWLRGMSHVLALRTAITAGGSVRSGHWRFREAQWLG